MTTTKAKPEVLKRSQAKIIERELTAIERKHGVITAKLVVKAAENPRSPLHKRFTWNDGEAAAKYREWEARMLIASVRVSYMAGDRDAITVRAFLNVATEDDQNYYGTARVMSDTELRSALLEEAQAELHRFKEKYGLLRELAAVFSAIEDL